MMAWRDSRFRVSFLPGSSPRPEHRSDARRLRGAEARGCFVVLVGPDESARLPSHVRCWPIIADRPLLSLPSAVGRSMAIGTRSNISAASERAAADLQCLAGSASSETQSDAGWCPEFVRPALKRSLLVVGDRWMFGYIVQPEAMKFHGPEWLARAVLHLLPRPHLIVNLAAPPSVIRGGNKTDAVAD